MLETNFRKQDLSTLPLPIQGHWPPNVGHLTRWQTDIPPSREWWEWCEWGKSKTRDGVNRFGDKLCAQHINLICWSTRNSKITNKKFIMPYTQFSKSKEERKCVLTSLCRHTGNPPWRSSSSSTSISAIDLGSHWPTDRRSRSTLIETGKGFLRSREELSAYRLRELRAELTQSGLCTFATPSLAHGIHESLNYHPQFLTPAIPFASSPLFRSKAYLKLDLLSGSRGDKIRQKLHKQQAISCVIKRKANLWDHLMTERNIS